MRRHQDRGARGVDVPQELEDATRGALVEVAATGFEYFGDRTVDLVAPLAHRVVDHSRRLIALGILALSLFIFLTDNRVVGDYHEYGCHRCRTFRMALTEARLELVRGATWRLEELAAHLARIGFERAEMVEDVAQFSVRGGIVDLYGFGMPAPARLCYDGPVLRAREARAGFDQHRRGVVDEELDHPLLRDRRGAGHH